MGDHRTYNTQIIAFTWWQRRRNSEFALVCELLYLMQGHALFQLPISIDQCVGAHRACRKRCLFPSGVSSLFHRGNNEWQQAHRHVPRRLGWAVGHPNRQWNLPYRCDKPRCGMRKIGTCAQTEKETMLLFVILCWFSWYRFFSSINRLLIILVFTEIVSFDIWIQTTAWMAQERQHIVFPKTTVFIFDTLLLGY